MYPHIFQKSKSFPCKNSPKTIVTPVTIED